MKRTRTMIQFLGLLAVSALIFSAGCGSESGDVSKSKASVEAPAENKAGEVAAETVELKPQETCPVMGGKIQKELYTDYNGKRIYFCCGGCDKTFQKNPEKFLAKMKRNGETPEDMP